VRFSKLIVGCLVPILAISPALWSQDQSNAEAGLNKKQSGLSQQPSIPEQGIPGFFDPRSNVFTARPQVVAQAAPVATTTTLARLVFNFTILNDQNSPTSTTCSVGISSSDAAGYNSESGYAQATNNGTTCTVTILFSWDLATPASDSLNINYSISSGNTAGSRYGSHSLQPIPMPTNYQTLTLPTINATI
jgi:hypothetical protein